MAPSAWPGFSFTSCMKVSASEIFTLASSRAAAAAALASSLAWRACS
eukprot:CAMPEP_0114611466 /NCGR_PEP_ID=MMETSP0168-20121206/4130_1 /TAXON_ID=95228 ORGANISM="Vannella sp., Strain DIVA3 517/6/12" /NCGR_SAMPLE_ID=MMETSP0168 /ASSEMBLY_ACC=CAM_ASM_000044 /LENGTH=46 /DNA_ID= /DNA_START= /DNA_END= /DNA_ORIENTATION=